MRNRVLAMAIFILAVFLCHTVFAQAVIVELKNIYPQELRLEGFRLDSEQDVQIDAAGLYFEDGREERLMFGYCWLLDAQTRDVVWEFQPEAFNRRDREARQVSETIKLPAGVYEVYYSSFPYYEHENGWSNSWSRWNRGFVSRILDNIFDRDDYSNDRFREDIARDFFFALRGKGAKISQDALHNIQKQLRADALISMAASGNELYERKGFTLERPIELEIYAIGEVRQKENFDYSFIMNSETREKVWILDYRHSDYAGGASKNRMARETITFPAGRYVAVMTTDDSHSPEEWNSPPPNDPAFWGLTISAKNSDQKKYFSKYDYEEIEAKNAIVAFTRMRDDAFESKGFTLRKPMDLHIYAIGEGRDGEMYDYGWIVNAKTNEKVWEMDFYDAEHAGGGEKNRLADEIVKFDKGSYIAYFITDGSHSFRDWNASPPHDPMNWGITASLVK